MANPIQPRPEAFRAELENGQIVEADGSTVADPATTSQVPAVLLRMTPARAHTLAHVLDDWARCALTFTAPRSAEVTERALAWTLEQGAAALGDADARRCPRSQPEAPSAAQRLAAVAVLREREPGITPVQGIAVIDAAARWLGDGGGEDLAQALIQAACRDAITANYVYLALIEPGGNDQ
ncbi:MAG TPA: hypothetical protein VFQ44_06830 [Streptosporangiaceae bacterium]|nr:hypothetical protein [Streptosporangiaceae bacterium]